MSCFHQGLPPLQSPLWLNGQDGFQVGNRVFCVHVLPGIHYPPPDDKVSQELADHHTQTHTQIHTHAQKLESVCVGHSSSDASFDLSIWLLQVYPSSLDPLCQTSPLHATGWSSSNPGWSSSLCTNLHPIICHPNSISLTVIAYKMLVSVPD